MDDTTESLKQSIDRIKQLVAALDAFEKNLRKVFFIGDNKAMSNLSLQAELIIEELAKEAEKLGRLDYTDEITKAKANQRLFELLRKADDLLGVNRPYSRQMQERQELKQESQPEQRPKVLGMD